MPKSPKTFSVVTITYGSASESASEVEDIKFESGFGGEELTAKLAAKPSDVEYRVFTGPEVKWQARTIIDIGAPRTRKPRAKPGRPVGSKSKPKPNADLLGDGKGAA